MAKFYLTGPNEGKTRVIGGITGGVGRFQFIDGVLEVPSAQAEAVASIVCRYHGAVTEEGYKLILAERKTGKQKGKTDGESKTADEAQTETQAAETADEAAGQNAENAGDAPMLTTEVRRRRPASTP